MTLLALVAVLASPAYADDWFFTGRGDETAVWTDDGHLGGAEAWPTGVVLAEVDDPTVRLPGVLRSVPLRGDGRTLRLVPTADTDVFALSRALHQRDDVRWAHPDFRFQLVLHDVPDDPYLEDQWHLENLGIDGSMPGVDVRAIPAWDITNGEGGMVAVLDSGVDTEHPDLRVINGTDYIDRDDDSNPTDNAHGTAAAGLAAAAGDNGTGVTGVAWGADVYGIRIIGGEGTTSQDIRDAFIESADAGATVINNSWGYGQGCPDIPFISAINTGLKYAEEEARDGLGVAVVFSAGNGGCDIGNNWMLNEETVVAVGASSRADVKEGYSSYGDTLDIVAPSGGVLTTDISGERGYGDFEGDQDYTPGFSGTSASAPIVSGVFALMFAANPDLTVAEARQVVCETATRIDLDGGEYDETGWSPYYGCGRIDAAAAVAAVANTKPGGVSALGPGETAYVESVVLSWSEAVDPDGDPLVYEVRWWVSGDDESTKVITDVPWYDLTGQVAVDDKIGWQVTPADAWGEGPQTEPVFFDVVATPEQPGPKFVPVEADEKGGCNTAPVGGLAGALLALVAVVRRRR